MAVLAIMAAAARAFPMPTASRPLVAAVAAVLAARDRELSAAGDATAPLYAARLSPFRDRATSVPPAGGERALEGKFYVSDWQLLAAGLLFDCLAIYLILCCYGFLY